MNDAPGTAWSSLVIRDGERSATVVGTLALDDPRPLNGGSVAGGHRFDLASLTKAFVAVAALTLVDEGLDLDEPVSPVVPVGTGPGAERITLRHLLTHTAGLPASDGGWREGLRGDALLQRLLSRPVLAPPGDAHLYSCVGYIAVGLVLEAYDRRPLNEIVERRVLAPLGATATFAPDPAHTVATEIQPHRGLVRGRVHDELADALERPVGNAGLFGTADDVVRLAEMIGREGEGALGGVITPRSARRLCEPTVAVNGYGQAIGLRVADPTFMGPVHGVGHTGFTGTSFVLRPDDGSVAVLLTNRVHPRREGADISVARIRVAQLIAPDLVTPPASRGR